MKGMIENLIGNLSILITCLFLIVYIKHKGWFRDKQSTPRSLSEVCIQKTMKIPFTCQNPTCRHEFETIDEMYVLCPKCHGADVKVLNWYEQVREIRELERDEINGKYKFDPDWMKDPETKEEVYRGTISERDEVIAQQAIKIERYEKALKEIAEMPYGLREDMVKKAKKVLQG